MIEYYLNTIIMFNLPNKKVSVLGLIRIKDDKVLCYTPDGIRKYEPRGMSAYLLSDKEKIELEKLSEEERVKMGYCIWHSKLYIGKIIEKRIN